jgi:hypothetical protein
MNSLFKSRVPGASPGASTTTVTYPCQGQIELRNGGGSDALSTLPSLNLTAIKLSWLQLVEQLRRLGIA